MPPTRHSVAPSSLDLARGSSDLDLGGGGGDNMSISSSMQGHSNKGGSSDQTKDRWWQRRRKLDSGSGESSGGDWCFTSWGHDFSDSSTRFRPLHRVLIEAQPILTWMKIFKLAMWGQTSPHRTLWMALLNLRSEKDYKEVDLHYISKEKLLMVFVYNEDEYEVRIHKTRKSLAHN